MKNQERNTFIRTKHKRRKPVKSKNTVVIQIMDMQSKETDYELLFIRQASMTARQGKTTYLRGEFHDRIQRIISLYNNPKLSVYAYIDAVLEQHFDQYKENIVAIYNEKSSTLF